MKITLTFVFGLLVFLCSADSDGRKAQIAEKYQKMLALSETSIRSHAHDAQSHVMEDEQMKKIENGLITGMGHQYCRKTSAESTYMDKCSGGKNSLYDKCLQLQSTAFHGLWSDPQCFCCVPLCECKDMGKEVPHDMDVPVLNIRYCNLKYPQCRTMSGRLVDQSWLYCDLDIDCRMYQSTHASASTEFSSQDFDESFVKAKHQSIQSRLSDAHDAQSHVMEDEPMKKILTGLITGMGFLYCSPTSVDECSAGGINNLYDKCSKLQRSSFDGLWSDPQCFCCVPLCECKEMSKEVPHDMDVQGLNFRYCNLKYPQCRTMSGRLVSQSWLYCDLDIYCDVYQPTHASASTEFSSQDFDESFVKAKQQSIQSRLSDAHDAQSLVKEDEQFTKIRTGLISGMGFLYCSTTTVDECSAEGTNNLYDKCLKLQMSFHGLWSDPQCFCCVPLCECKEMSKVVSKEVPHDMDVEGLDIRYCNLKYPQCRTVSGRLVSQSWLYCDLDINCNAGLIELPPTGVIELPPIEFHHHYTSGNSMTEINGRRRETRRRSTINRRRSWTLPFTAEAKQQSIESILSDGLKRTVLKIERRLSQLQQLKQRESKIARHGAWGRQMRK